MSNKVVVQGGVGFPGLLFIVLLVCKLFGANITWFWVFAPSWIPVDDIDKYEWAFGHDEIIKEFTEWMHLEDGDLDMQDIDLDPV